MCESGNSSKRLFLSAPHSLPKLHPHPSSLLALAEEEWRRGAVRCCVRTPAPNVGGLACAPKARAYGVTTRRRFYM